MLSWKIFYSFVLITTFVLSYCFLFVLTYIPFFLPPRIFYECMSFNCICLPQSPLEETDILNMLPDKPTTLDMMIVTKILSQRGTKSLGDFEVQYIFEPEARKVVDQ